MHVKGSQSARGVRAFGMLCDPSTGQSLIVTVEVSPEEAAAHPLPSLSVSLGTPTTRWENGGGCLCLEADVYFI